MKHWNKWPDATPVGENVLCDVITSGGDERQLVWSKNLWWLPDMSMYVYFVPAMWRQAPPPTTQQEGEDFWCQRKKYDADHEHNAGCFK